MYLAIWLLHCNNRFSNYITRISRSRFYFHICIIILLLQWSCFILRSLNENLHWYNELQSSNFCNLFFSISLFSWREREKGWFKNIAVYRRGHIIDSFNCYKMVKFNNNPVLKGSPFWRFFFSQRNHNLYNLLWYRFIQKKLRYLYGT